MNPELPVVLSSLFDNSLADADYPTLLKKSEEAFELLQVTKKQQELVEDKTREQASSRLWFRMRTGRITASKFKNACHADPACPSHSLIMSICHPEMARLILKQPNGAVITRRPQGSLLQIPKREAYKFHSVRLRSLSKH